MAEKEKRRATTFVTSRGAIINVAAPSVYIAPGVTPVDVTSPAELREALREALSNQTLLHWVNKKGFAEHPENPLIPAGAAGEWDNLIVEGATSVFFGEDNQFWIYYHGHIAGTKYHIGLARSPDLVRWTKEPTNPVLAPGPAGSWDAGFVADACVIQVDTLYHMWYTGYDGVATFAVGHATSTDGVNWTKDPANPVLTCNTMPTPCVIEVYDELWMYYIVFTEVRSGIWVTDVRLAFSDDGTVWKRYENNPVFSPGGYPKWVRNMVFHPKVLYFNGLWMMTYVGMNSLAAYPRRMGVAFSIDGKDFVDYPWNPVLWPREVTNSIEVACPFIWDGVLYVFYNNGPYFDWTTGVRRADLRLMERPREDYFLEADGTVWNAAALAGGENTLGIPVRGYDEATIYFLSDTAGVLTIQVQEPDGDWRTYDTPVITANTLKVYPIGGDVLGVRLSFNVVAIVTAWYHLT